MIQKTPPPKCEKQECFKIMVNSVIYVISFSFTFSNEIISKIALKRNLKEILKQSENKILSQREITKQSLAEYQLTVVIFPCLSLHTCDFLNKQFLLSLILQRTESASCESVKWTSFHYCSESWICNWWQLSPFRLEASICECKRSNQRGKISFSGYLMSAHQRTGWHQYCLDYQSHEFLKILCPLLTEIFIFGELLENYTGII